MKLSSWQPGFLTRCVVPLKSVRLWSLAEVAEAPATRNILVFERRKKCPTRKKVSPSIDRSVMYLNSFWMGRKIHSGDPLYWIFSGCQANHWMLERFSNKD